MTISPRGVFFSKQKLITLTITYVFGGFGSGISPDLYSYDLRDHSWDKKSLEMISGAGKPPRLYCHTSVFYDGLIFNFGGWRLETNSLSS